MNFQLSILEIKTFFYEFCLPIQKKFKAELKEKRELF
jgi:hypothetical protein